MSAPGDPGFVISNPDEDVGPTVLGSTLSVTILAFLVMSTRLWVRCGMIRNPGWDDGLMTFAMSIVIAGQATIIGQVQHGAGKHIGDVDPLVYMTGMKLNFISQPLFLWATCFVKLAVGASLLRIANRKLFKYSTIGVMIFQAVYTTACFFTIMFQCTDVRILWDPTVVATCWDQPVLQALGYTNAAINIVTDFIFAVIIPVPLLWSLQVATRTRLVLMGILGLGLFACAASIVKMGYLVNYGLRGDWLWDSANITIWSSIESNIGIVAGSLPSLKPLFKRFFETASAYYGKGSRNRTMQSGAGQSRLGATLKGGANSQWETLSSARRPGDETSSERELKTEYVVDQYELGERGAARGTKTTIYSQNDKQASDESLDKMIATHGMNYSHGPGIKKTTTTHVHVSDKR